MILPRAWLRTATRTVVAAIIAGGACGVSAREPEPLTAARFVHLSEMILSDQIPASGRSVYVGTEMRRTLLAPSTSPPLLFPVDEEGYLHLRPSEQLPSLESGSEGLRLLIHYYDGPISLFSTNRKGFEFVSREAIKLNETLRLRPPGESTGRARVYARQVMPQRQELLTCEVVVPPGGQLDFAIALLQDWRVPGGTGAIFRIKVVLEERTELLYEEILMQPEHFEEGRWSDRTVGMGGYAGECVRFLFETLPLSANDDPDGRFAFPLWGDPVLHSQVTPRASGLPNIVLIALDTLRADRLGCYGYARPTSPCIDRFSEKNILFEKAIAPSSWTMPSFGSLFTGLHPSRHQTGLFRTGFVLDSRFVTLAERLGKPWRMAAAYTEGIAVRAQLGYSQGFDIYSDGETPDRHETGTAEGTFRRATAWLDRFGHLPFFLFVHTYECHEPYAPPAPWDLMFADPGYSGQAGFLSQTAVNEEDRRHTSNRYDGCVAYTDHWTGWFLEQMEARQLLENTIVVVFADHGEEFWEHEGYGHGLTLYDEVLHIPLILHLPDGTVKPQRIGEQVLLTDLFATLLELSGQEVHGETDSCNLLPLICPGAETYARKCAVSELYNSETDYKDASGFPLEWLMRSVRYPDYKYVVSNKPVLPAQGGTPPAAPNPVEYLFNLIEDPEERHNIVEEDNERLSRLKLDLLEFLKASEPLEDVSGRESVQVDSLDDADIESLQALGYL